MLIVPATSLNHQNFISAGLCSQMASEFVIWFDFGPTPNLLHKSWIVLSVTRISGSVLFNKSSLGLPSQILNNSHIYPLWFPQGSLGNRDCFLHDGDSSFYSWSVCFRENRHFHFHVNCLYKKVQASGNPLCKHVSFRPGETSAKNKFVFWLAPVSHPDLFVQCQVEYLCLFLDNLQ